MVSQTIPEHAPQPSPLSLPTSPARPSNPLPSSLLQPLHTRLKRNIKQEEVVILNFRSASQPVRSSSPPSSPSLLHHHRSSSPPPPAPSGGGDGAELRSPLSRKPNSRSSMPSGELLLRINNFQACTAFTGVPLLPQYIFHITQENLHFLCHSSQSLQQTCLFTESIIFPQPTLGSRLKT